MQTEGTMTAHHRHTTTTNIAGETAASSVTGLHALTAAASALLPQHTENTKAGHGQNADASMGTASARPTPSIASVSATNNDISSTPPGELAQWKVIGISIICVTFVAIIIIAVTFFDTWTAFMKDVIGCGGCRKGRKDKRDEPHLVPDWNRRTWEFKLANQDGHRYPTMASMDSMTKAHSLTEMDYGHHAEQALGRKLSTR
ncbi:hypothetical protein EST38_g1811 [Candolleomyces aberdarensis]|uniref:Uncharacterized protein n=1 Tax=Candolleomyces aberdarensis TaxID=2316362 RepID=A0A4Q2DW66_9AGAR|nr:hypothetical protein EST38_g1811 [Candolleomyces aberdarensis]